MTLPDPPKEHRINKRDAKALLAIGGWRQDPELTQAVGCQAFSSSDGRALVLLPGRLGADLCDDRAALLRYYLALRAQGPQHMLADKFLHGETFPAQVPRLIDQLAADTGLERSTLDRSEESLLQVERAFSRRGGRRAFLTPERFPAVVAYAGEVLCQRIEGGSWKMELADGQWEPWIVGVDESRYPIFILVHDGLEQPRAGAILALIQGELRGRFLIRSSARKGGAH